MKENRYDFLIIGSGFSGSVCAAILASKGYSVAVVDRGRHPRFSIGESSTPIANMILRDLGVKYGLSYLENLCTFGRCRESYPSLSIGKKRGFTYFRHSPNTDFLPGRNHENELFVAASSSDFHSDTQWFRADIDSFLIDKASEYGVELFEGREVKEVRKEEAWKVSLMHENEAETVEANFIIDASGSGRVLQRLLKIPDSTYRFQTNTKASFSHFKGCLDVHTSFYKTELQLADLPYVSDNSAVHHIIEDSSWIWMLRFSNKITSVGLVASEDESSKNADLDLLSTIKRYPSISRLFEFSDVSGSPGRIIQTGRLQRASSSAAGDGWAMLPHTLGFVDPLHSTGIAWSLLGVESLTDILIGSEKKSVLNAKLLKYSQRLTSELQFIDSLCSICYKTMADFKKFTASCMLYFAASIGFEKSLGRRFRGEQVDTELSFLHSTLHGIPEIVNEAHKKISNPNYSDWLEEQIRPFNDVGLFRPEINNIYLHTIAEL